MFGRVNCKKDPAMQEENLCHSHASSHLVNEHAFKKLLE